MRYFLAAVSAVFFITLDFEGLKNQSAWTEPSFVAAVAQSEPVAVSPESHTGTVAASAEPASAEPASESRAPTGVEPVRDQSPTELNAATNAAVAVKSESSPPNSICEAIKTAAEENDIPVGFLARLLWQESKFRSKAVSSAGAKGIAQFMPRTAVEMGLSDPLDPLEAIPASASYLRKLHDQFGNLGLAAAAYNAGGGRIGKWLARRGPLPKETRAYVKIITGHKTEAWTDEENTVLMPIDLPEQAPCEGVGGLSKEDQIAEVPVDLAPSVSAVLAKVEAGQEKQVAKKSRLAASKTRAKVRTAAASRKTRTAAASRKTKTRTAAASRKTKAQATRMAGKTQTRKSGKSVVRLASDGEVGARSKSSKGRREL
jgi:hypothetical protein